MTWEIKCANCKKFIEKEAALLIGPPAANQAVSVNKYHLCHHCFDTVFAWIQGKGML